MYKDLRVIPNSTRKKPGMKEFFIFVMCYSYYNKRSTDNHEFSLAQTVLADYFQCSTKTIYRWLYKLKDIGCLSYAKREDAGKTGYYRVVEDGKTIKKSYVKPKYKRIRVGEKDDYKFVNVYTLDQEKLNKYFIETINEDIFSNIAKYKEKYFNSYIRFLQDRKMSVEKLEIIAQKDEVELSKKNKNDLKRDQLIKKRIEENAYYLKMKECLDQSLPTFTCRYLKEGCLRLTHDICNTVNPEHTDKIDDFNYWRSSHARNDMLTNILNTDQFEERDVNGSIYRLTYNLYHDNPLSISTDIYQEIWHTAFADIIWPDSSYRNKFKRILMPIYMKEYLIGYRASQYEFVKKYYAGHKNKYKHLDKNEREQYELYNDFVVLTGLSIRDFLDTVNRAMHTYLNTTKYLESAIFIQESNLFILMRNKFTSMGVDCANVYDGFYFKKDEVTMNDFYSVYNSSLLELKSNLNNGIGTPLRAI